MIAQAALCTDWHTAPTATQLIRSNLKHKPKLISLPVKVTGPVDLIRSTGPVTFTGSDISFGLCFKLDLMSWVAVGAVCQSVHNAA